MREREREREKGERGRGGRDVGGGRWGEGRRVSINYQRREKTDTGIAPGSTAEDICNRL